MIYVPEMDLLKMIRETLFDTDTLFNMRKNLKQVEKQNSTELILKELEQLVKGKEKAEETQIKMFYLQSQEDEQSIELIFDSTTIGNSYLCDAFVAVGETEKNVLVELKVFKGKDKTDEKIVVRRIKGDVSVDGIWVEKWAEIKEDSQLQAGNKVFVLKSYFEKVEKVRIDKSTTAKLLGSSIGIMLSRMGGLFRNIVIAAYFGVGRATDIFAIGLTIANLLRRIVAENALENAFLPIFSRIFHRTSRKKTWEAASSIVNFTLIVSLAAAVLLVIFTPVIIKTLFPAFANKGMTVDTINMTRLILPYLFLVTISAVMIVYLKAFSRFGIAESSTVFFSVGVIVTILLLTPLAGMYSLAYGILLGGLLQIVFLLPFIIKVFKIKSLQFSFKPVINFNSTFNKKYYSQLGPISLDVALSKIAEVVGKILASALKEGAIAVLHFSLIIFQLPFAVISQAISSVVLKEFSEKIALFDKNKAKQLYVDGIKTNLFLLTPLSILMIALAEPIVSVILEYGRFDSSMVTNTAYALKFYSIGLVGWGIHSLTVRIFSARIDIKTSMILNFFMLLVNVGLCLWLVNTSLTFAGLALATSLSFLIFAIIRVMVLRIKLEREEILIKKTDLLVSFAKTLLATVIMVIVLVEAKYVFTQLEFKSKLVGNFFLLFSLTFIGISVYLLTSLMLKNTELLIFKRKIRKREADVPVSMLSPFQFLEKVSRNHDAFKDDYFYKINIYTSSSRWEVRNVGIKLIGLFKDTSKVDYLKDLLRSKKENGFIKRNALYSLVQLNAWNPELKALLSHLLEDPYYEVRVAAILYLAKCGTANDYNDYKELILQRLKKRTFTIEEKLAWLKLVAKLGSKDELKLLQDFYLSSNSLIREELLELFYNLYRRKLLSVDELRVQVGKILITSNHLNPEFKLKSIIKKIYKEIE